MKLIVGLGNPGRKYEATRHNVGFEVLAELARMIGAGNPKSRFEGDLIDTRIDSQSALLLCPTTFMNRSGKSVRLATDFYRIAIEDVLIVCDDLNLPLGKLRLRPGGSAGGQKGLANIIQHVGTDEIARLRIGIGSPPERQDAADFVLNKFNKQDRVEMQHAVAVATDAILLWVKKDIQTCMNHFN